MTTIDYSYLLGLYGGTTSGLSLGSAATTIKKTPTSPWAVTAVKTEPTALVRSALNGKAFIDPSAAKLDVKKAAADYRQLFGLYQGLDMLTAIANRANEKSVTSLELTRLQKAFTRGMTELNTFLANDPFESIRLARTAVGTEAKSTVGAERPNRTYLTAALSTGEPGAASATFDGDVQFRVTVDRAGGPVNIDINLSEMGSTPRSVSSVGAFINGKLAAAGLESRFVINSLGSEPRTMKVGDRTITLPGANEKWGWKITAAAGEDLSFSAADRSDGVFVLQASGRTGLTELTKFQSDTGAVGAGAPEAMAGAGDTFLVDGRTVQAPMDKGIAAIRASASGPDGSLYVLAEANATIDGQPIKGERDVVLLKYDSAGQLSFTRTLGAADEANANAIAVSADGKIAIAGSVKGALDKGDAGAGATQSDSFVTLFDETGAELWTQRRGAKQDDEATAVAFGPDGQVIVGGRTKGALTGALGGGGWDGYLRTFTSTGLLSSTQQFGGATDDGVSAISVQGGVIVTAGAEGGAGVVRRFELQPSGEPVQTQQRNIGPLSGSISAVNLDGGHITVVGTTKNAALNVGTVTRAHAGDSDAFIARMDADLATTGADRLTYLGGEGADTGAAATFSGGKVWIAGQVGVNGKDATLAAQGRLSRVNAETGAIEWDRTLMGEGGLIAPAAVSVSEGGASVLDRLGLPSGKLDFSTSNKVVDTTSVRAGDQFHINLGGGRMRTVTVTAEDTFATLANKINSASLNRLKAEVVKSSSLSILKTDADKPGGQDLLKVTLRPGRAEVEIVAGTGGRDALEALGLNQTVLQGTGAFKDDRSPFALKLPADLDISNKESIKAALEALQTAITQVQAAYRDLSKKDQPLASQVTGAMPAYEASRIASYTAALQRLSGG